MLSWVPTLLIFNWEVFLTLSFCWQTERHFRSLTHTHHVEDGGVLAGGEHHLRLEGRMQEEALRRHRAASTVGAEGENGCECQRHADTVHPQREEPAVSISGE